MGQPFQEPTHQTVRQVIADYLEVKRQEFVVGAIKEKHYRRIENHLASFALDFGGKAVIACRSDLLTSWWALHPSWKSGHTVQDAFRVIISCFIWAADEGLITRNPFKIPRNTVPTLLPRASIPLEDFKRLYHLARHVDTSKPSRSLFRVCLRFLWETGCRTCEAWDARWENLSWGKGYVVIPRPKTFRKTGKARVLVFDAKMLRVIRCLWMGQGRPATGLIFQNGRGRQWLSPRFAKHFNRYAAAAGIPPEVSAASIRHGVFSEGVLRGVSSKQLADVAGHTTTAQIERVYATSTAAMVDHLHRVSRQMHGEKKKELPPT